MAIRPAMATIPGSLLLVISSPYARSEILFEHYRDYCAKDDPDILVWQSSTRMMNPTIDAVYDFGFKSALLIDPSDQEN